MGERGFEAANLGGDLWAMGFDVDLALEAHRKSSINQTAVGTTSSGNGNVNIGGYGDMQHMLLHTGRFEDELNDGDISQITDLTNSLPKGDTESAQSFLAKIACHDLTRELGATQGTSQKSIEASLFGSVNDDGSHNNSAITQKASLLPVDVYGRVTLCEGKLVLQLRHFNVNTNYPVNVSECWLCREKISNGSSLNSHKHVLQGLFQVNDEFVQMDIDHYIIPEQALEPDPTDVNRNLSSSNLISSSPSNISHVNSNRSLTLGEDMECPGNLQGQHVNLSTIGNTLHTSHRSLITANESLQTPKCNQEIHYTETDLNNALTTAQQSLNSTVPIDSNSFLNTFTSSDLRMGTVPSVIPQAPNDNVLINHVNETVSPTSTSFPPPTLPLPSCNNTCNNNDNLIPSNGTTETNSTLNGMENIQALCTSNNSTTTRNDGFLQHTTYETNITSKGQLENYQNFFSQPYSYYESSDFNQHISKFPTNQLTTSSTNQFYDSTMSSSSPNKRIEVGAKKRKNKAKKKPSSIRMRDEIEQSTISSVLDDKKSISDAKVSSQQSINNVYPPNYLYGTENKSENNLNCLNKNGFHKKMSSNSSSCELVSSSTNAIPPSIDFNVNCPFCKVEYTSKKLSEFKTHIGRHRYDVTHLFTCPVCSKKISGSFKYIQHLKVHSQKRHYCSLCDAHYSRPDKLRRHIVNVHDSEKPFVCDICSKAFNRMEYLKAHKNIHLGKKFECDICHKFYSSQFNLKAHKQQHSNIEPPFACDLCNKSYLRKDILDFHISKDHKKKRYKCDVCLKLFSRDDILRRHKEMHDEKRATFSCEFCYKKFYRKDNLKAHSYEHKKEKGDLKQDKKQCKIKKQQNLKPFKKKEYKEQCKICLKYFPTSLKLEKHMQLHETNINIKGKLEKDALEFLKCDVCVKSFKTLDMLKRHNSRVHRKVDCYDETEIKVKREINEKKFFCEICSKGFTRSCNLKAHLKTHLKNSEDDEVLAEIPTVLNASKTKSLKQKKSFLSLAKNSNGSMTYSSFELISSASCSNSGFGGDSCSKEQESGMSSVQDSLGRNLDPSTNLCPYNSHLPSHIPSELPISSSFCSSPNSPINLSTEAISTAAYLLTHPFYEGTY